jgi:hypothetical protein
MTELPSKPTRKITDDPYGAAILIRRLVMEQGFVYWRRYVTAFALMGVSAGATAGSDIRRPCFQNVLTISLMKTAQYESSMFLLIVWIFRVWVLRQYPAIPAARAIIPS